MEGNMVKKKVEKSESMVCMPNMGSKELVHTVLAGLILVSVFMTTSWAQWIIVLAAAVIFVSGIVSYCRTCKK